jgi:histone H3/H4
MLPSIKLSSAGLLTKIPFERLVHRYGEKVKSDHKDVASQIYSSALDFSMPLNSFL